MTKHIKDKCKESYEIKSDIEGKVRQNQPLRKEKNEMKGKIKSVEEVRGEEKKTFEKYGRNKTNIDVQKRGYGKVQRKYDGKDK